MELPAIGKDVRCYWQSKSLSSVQVKNSINFFDLSKKRKEIIYNKNILNDNPALNLTNTYTIKDNLKLFNNIKIKNNILKNYTINSTLYNFYNNDNISMSSQIMSNCNKTLVKKSNY